MHMPGSYDFLTDESLVMVLAYLDYNATTPVDPHVLESMRPFFSEDFGNPSSVHHASGAKAAEAVEHARKQVADTVGLNTADVIFTSGATEANNLALTGLKRGMGRHLTILAGATEHKSVLETCNVLAEGGSTFGTIPVNSDGTLNLESLESLLSDDTDVVSVMAANSETGVMHPIEEAVKLVHEYGSIFHCDATQAIGRIPFDAGRLDIDMVTLSSHKIYGPKGCGALVATREVRRKMSSVIYGGGQERNMRSGTLNVPAIVGFGTACKVAMSEGIQDAGRQQHIRDTFEDEIKTKIPDVLINGIGAMRIPNTSNIRIRGALADAVMNRAHAIEISSGSACASSTMEPSHVLLAMGLDRTAADESIRVSVGRHTTMGDIDSAVSEIAKAVEFVRGVEVGGVV